IRVVEEVRVARDHHQWRSAISYVRAVAVHARYAEIAPDEIAIIEAGDSLPLPGPADQAVPKERRRKDIGAADRRHLCAQCASADIAAGRTQGLSPAAAEGRIAIHRRAH